MTKKRYDSTRQWYAIHTYSGYEEKVADSIRQRIQAVDMADKIFDAIVPKEKQIQIKNGKRKIINQPRDAHHRARHHAHQNQNVKRKDNLCDTSQNRGQKTKSN